MWLCIAVRKAVCLCLPVCWLIFCLQAAAVQSIDKVAVGNNSQLHTYTLGSVAVNNYYKSVCACTKDLISQLSISLVMMHIQNTYAMWQGFCTQWNWNMTAMHQTLFMKTTTETWLHDCHMLMYNWSHVLPIVLYNKFGAIENIKYVPEKWIF